MKMEPKPCKVKELLEWRERKMLSINAEYQRGAVWSQPQKKRLIDSILRGYPIPLIYLHYIKNEVAGFIQEHLEVIDGQQRINALYEYQLGSFPLFDPNKDERTARFPAFIKNQPCPWGGMKFESLSGELKSAFMERDLPVVMITTTDPNEAKDLFIRLQAGMPLNPQEKRDAWPGDFTDFILRIGGKPELEKEDYNGHPFFKTLMKARNKSGRVGARNTSGRGKYRQLAAQMFMLYFQHRKYGPDFFCDLNAKPIDDFYYEHLDFDRKGEDAERFVAIINKLVDLLGDKKRKKLIGHEAIHLVLLVDGLLDDYTRSWEGLFAPAFDAFRNRVAKDKKTDGLPGEYWLKYGTLTRGTSDKADIIRQRNNFFCLKMCDALSPLEPKDKQRMFGPLEREIIYYRDKKKCAVCGSEVSWDDFDVHHIKQHDDGGPTRIDNGVVVHRDCHPKGGAAEEFAEKWKAQQPNA